MTIRRYDATAITSSSYALGEGIRVDDGRPPAWIDIPAGQLIVGSWERNGTWLTERQRIKIDVTVGAVGAATDDGWVVAGARRLYSVSSDGRVTAGPDVMPEGIQGRLNDGALDARGRFVVGSLLAGDERPAHELWRVEATGSVEVLRRDIGLSNGLGWSPDGSRLYHVDTAARTLSFHRYDEDPWDPDGWEPIPCDFAGAPDGLAVDQLGDIWVAQWGGGGVQSFTPAGRLTAEVAVPVPDVTCPAFVGDGRMLITTAGGGAGRSPGDGLLYVADIGIAGVATGLWPAASTRS